MNTLVDQLAIGLYSKFSVTRADGRHAPGEKHHACDYFVLDLTHDRHAWPAIAAYANACEAEYPQLAADLRNKMGAHYRTISEFTIVPETTLPNGIVVPAFRVSRYLMSKGPDGAAISVPDLAPWVRINYHEARSHCLGEGLALLSETQALAIAWNLYNVDANWIGGKVGEGSLYQGLRKGNVDAAQPGSYVPDDADEQRWFTLSNGERICDAAGNAFTWITDDVQGDENGLTTIIKADSISLQAPHPSLKKGLGWRPEGDCKWSGDALIRGGYWDSGSNAGVFNLDLDWPDYGNGSVGFRSTKPIGH